MLRICIILVRVWLSYRGYLYFVGLKVLYVICEDLSGGGGLRNWGGDVGIFFLREDVGLGIVSCMIFGF